MALFCSLCNNSSISPSPSFTSSAVRHVSAFKPQFLSLPIFSFKQSYLTDLSQKKSHFPKCSDSSVEQQNDDDNSTTIIFLKGLAKSTPEGRLKVVFSQFGNVNRVKILTDKKSKESLGFAYIWFPDNESAQSAIEEMNGKMADLYRFRWQSLDLASQTSSQCLTSSSEP
ncbi:transformer-2 protein homolog beta-like isoform X1 [Solanum pennellii]|uniref:Transformer-2 protein homolog beta-like isoform X1 n=1 Tax=Solanum pennellii TaxID=28526 RepID=A0ABM1GYH3_SOLPN|nr:transformer-2 protein homolog beta-like isoform X1 [Solanum pennellii]